MIYAGIFYFAAETSNRIHKNIQLIDQNLLAKIYYNSLLQIRLKAHLHNKSCNIHQQIQVMRGTGFTYIYESVQNNTRSVRLVKRYTIFFSSRTRNAFVIHISLLSTHKHIE